MKQSFSSAIKQDATAPNTGTVVTKAVLRAAEQLGVSNRGLSKIIGVSEPSVSRMGMAAYTLEEGQKSYELALLFIRLFRSLDAITGGDQAVNLSWMKNDNLALGGRPMDAIQSVSGLTHTINYLDARRAIV